MQYALREVLYFQIEMIGLWNRDVLLFLIIPPANCGLFRFRLPNGMTFNTAFSPDDFILAASGMLKTHFKMSKLTIRKIKYTTQADIRSTVIELGHRHGCNRLAIKP